MTVTSESLRSAATAPATLPPSFDLAPRGSDLERVERTLDDLDELTERLTEEENYAVAPRDYPLPKGFVVSVVVPVYNEEATIARIIGRLRALPLPLEIVIVDDRSTDRTREILRRYENDAHMHIIYKSQNEGKGAALRTGLTQARGDVVAVQDADLEYDPRDLVRLVRPLAEGRADVVYGSRYLPDLAEPDEFRLRRHSDRSLIHRIGNGALTWASNCFTGLRLTDMETCYKVFRREVIQRIELQQDRFGFDPEVTAKIARQKVRVLEAPISYQPRTYAEGKKIGLRDLCRTLFCIVQYGVWERG